MLYCRLCQPQKSSHTEIDLLQKSLIWIKAILTLLGSVLLSAVQVSDPANFITLTGEAASVYDDGAKAASFALVAAMAIAVQRLHTGDNREDKLVDLATWAVMAAAGFMAAWYWLKDETGDPLPYLEEILIVGFVIVVFVVVPIFAGAGLSWWRDRRRRRGGD